MEGVYLRKAAQSVAALCDHLRGWKIEWLIAPDGVKEEWIEHTIADINAPYKIVAQGDEVARSGPAFPRNRALKQASSYWVMSLDEDDEYIASGMADLLKAVCANDSQWGAGLIYDIDDQDKIINKGPEIELNKVIPLNGIQHFKEKHGYFPFMCCATIAKTALVKQVGGWAEDPKLKRCEDMAMWFAINANNEGLWLNKPVLKYRNNPDSITHQKEWGNGLESLDRLTEYAAKISKRKVLLD